MLTDPVTLVGDTASSRAYALRSIVAGKSVRAAAIPTGLATEETLTIGSTVSSKGQLSIVRYLIRFDRSLPSVLFGSVNVAWYVVIEVPQDPAITPAIIKDMRTQSNNLLVDATLTKILNKEP